jgi:hypothetical protein
LASFAGCFDKVLGVEYEDCFFQVDGLSPNLTRWLNDTVNGSNVFRDVVVTQVDPLTRKDIVRLQIAHAFLRDFRVSDADGSSTSIGSLRFAVVPTSLSIVANATTTGGGSLTFHVADFRLSGFGVDGSQVAAVRGVHMSAPKIVATPIGSRHQFSPGAPQFDDIRLEVGTAGNTISDLQAWVNNVAQGQVDLRPGDLQFLTPNLQVVLGTVHFLNVSPTGFAPFPTSTNQRLIDLVVGSFLFQ